jgi:raffinose/stachyose/melibiose transport system permease protein
VSLTNRMGRIVIFLLLCLIGASAVYPLLFMALNSFRTTSAFELSPFGLPTSFHFNNYHTLLQEFPFEASLLHSVIVVIPADILATLFSALAAFVFTKTSFRGANVLFYTMLLVMLMPAVVLIIPLYVTVVHIGLANSFAPAILIYAAINIPFGTYLLRANFRGIPDSLVEAARVDGASLLRVFRSIIVPAGLPGIITVGILTFLNAWNELFLSIVLLHTSNREMLTPALTQLSGRYSTDIQVLMAGLLLGALPTVFIYLISARVFVRGLMAGSSR